MNRRHFIGIGLGVTTLPLIEGCRSDSPWLNLLAKPTGLARFCDEKELKIIGNKYLQQFPGENKSHRLQQLILPDNFSGTSEALLQQLHENKKSDFQQGNTVIVNGWVLSKTEARQCALFVLTAS